MLDARKLRKACKNVVVDSSQGVDATGLFPAALAQELKTPLDAMLGMLDVVMTTPMTPKQSEYLAITYSSGQDLMRLVDEMLTFSTMEVGGMQLVSQDCYLLEILDEVVDLLAEKALKKSIGLGYVIAHDMPKSVITDVSKLRHLLIQLLDNAIKFTHFGEVSIYVEQNNSNDDQVCFYIKDTGIGIAKEYHDLIFEPFFQVEPLSTTVYEGTGLGLALVQKMVDRLGGCIKLASELGEGSQFSISIPVEFSEKSFQEDDVIQLHEQGFLLVTRSQMIRDFVENSLSSMGGDLVVADSGQDAINKISILDAKTFQAILIDEDLEDMTVTDFIGLTQDCLGYRDKLSLVFTNPYFSSYHLDGLPVINFNKPLKWNSLKQQLAKRFGFVHRESQSQLPLNGRSSVGQDATKVLVIEDNRINQQLVENILRRLGCQYEMATNGKLGVEKVVYGNFDLVMMDCNMPVLSGYSATRQIREFEGDDAGTLPIIATIASNSESEKTRCLESGVSDFLTKPLSMVDVRDILTKWTSFSEAKITYGFEFQHRIAEPERPDQYVELSYDIKALDQLVAVVGDSIYGMIDDFSLDMRTYANGLKTAVSENNISEVRYISHTIKGAARNFGARELVDLSTHLEDRAKDGELKDAESFVSSIDRSIDRLCSDLKNHTKSKRKLEPVADRFESRDKVLVVDDDRTSRVVLAEALRNNGCNVDEAKDGPEALEICRHCMPDLILMDAIMPGLDGFNLCQKIRQMPYGADIPILIITASESEEAVAMAFSVAATDFIGKPVNVSVIQKRVSHLIASSKTERYMKQLAYHDALTGLPNRTSLMQHLQLAINQVKVDGTIFAVLFLDLDHFKVVNDNLGHDAGDLLLKAVSERLLDYLRGEDFIARLGGDEFTIVLQAVKSLQAVETVARQICDLLSQPFMFMRREILITTSIGISVFPDDGKEISDLLKHADSAMFSAKNIRNHFCFYKPGMETEVSQRLELQRDLRRSFDRDELRLYYQPKMDSKTGSLLGAEALLRWQHPTKGLIGPDEFIEVAEGSDLIVKINQWVLANGISKLSTWLSQGYKLSLSINVSLSAPKLENLYDEISALLHLHSLPNDLLELEITERALIYELDSISQQLSKIRQLGIKIALDDFGNGHSSLHHLKKLPVDVLKIDQIFIRDIESSEDDYAIVESIVFLAEKLGVQTVAEGIENEGQRKILIDLNCDSFQGHLVSEAIEAEAFERQFLEKAKA
jgi:diguanylate cyclase (GGDEF)-like protein